MFGTNKIKILKIIMQYKLNKKRKKLIFNKF